MSDSNDTCLSQVSGWVVGSIKKNELIIIRPEFSTDALQQSKELNPGHMYEMTVQQARDLISEIQKQLDRLDNIAPKSLEDQQD